MKANFVLLFFALFTAVSLVIALTDQEICNKAVINCCDTTYGTLQSATLNTIGIPEATRIPECVNKIIRSINPGGVAVATSIYCHTQITKALLSKQISEALALCKSCYGTACNKASK